MNAPDVSVVIPVFNRTQWVARAVRSCLGSSCAVEVVVVDDGSEEPVADVLRGITVSAPDRVTTLRREHQGACAARNAGLEQATGEFIKFLDSDDELLPGVLAQEVRAARESGADGVVTGWEEQTCDAEGREQPNRRRTVSAPDLRGGIDDMLLGRGPWTSAALYKRSFVRDLRWDPAWTKAQDWGWSLTVCLAGARFVSLDVPSAVYHHHAADRITADGDRGLRSTQARQYFLRMIEDRLRARGDLTEERRRRLAQYYYKDSRVVCGQSPGEWRRLWRHCRELAPGFRPRESSRLVRLYIRLAGVYLGIRTYVAMKKAYDKWVRRRLPPGGAEGRA